MSDLIDEEQDVRLGFNKLNLRERRCSKADVPSARGLLEPIQRLVEPTNIVRGPQTRRPHAVYCLCQGTKKEHVLHISLVHRLVPWKGQGEHIANRGRLHHRTGSLNEINARTQRALYSLGLLRKSSKDPASLVPLQSAISIELVLEDPLSGHLRTPWH